MMIDIFNWALELGVATTVLIGLVLLLRRPMAHLWGSGAVYCLWALPFLRLFMPEIRLPVETNVNVPWPTDFYQFETFGDAPLQSSEPAAAAPAIIETGLQVPDWPVLVTGIWIIFAAAWISWHLYRHVKYWHLLDRVSSPINEDLKVSLQKATNIIGLRKLPRVKIAPKAIGPIVSGVFRPLIILPPDFETTYTEDEQIYALCHEIAHIKRCDIVAALALLIFRAVHWYNPLVHYAARHFRLDQEAACDAFLLSRFQDSDKMVYAQILLKAARRDPNKDGTAIERSQGLSLAFTKE